MGGRGGVGGGSNLGIPLREEGERLLLFMGSPSGIKVTAASQRERESERAW